VPVDQGPPPYDVLAALVVSLRGELADALAALGETRAELGQAQERIDRVGPASIETLQCSCRKIWPTGR